MNYAAVIAIVIIIAVYLIMDRIFQGSLKKVLGVIKLVFIPFGLLMWIYEIIIFHNVSIHQFGFMYSAFSYCLYVAVWLFDKLIIRLNNSRGTSRIIGFAYISLMVLLLLAYIMGRGFLNIYFG